MLTHDDVATTKEATLELMQAARKDNYVLKPFGGVEFMSHFTMELRTVHDKMCPVYNGTDDNQPIPDVDIIYPNICRALSVLYHRRAICGVIMQNNADTETLSNSLSDIEVIDAAIKGWLSVLTA